LEIVLCLKIPAQLRTKKLKKNIHVPCDYAEFTVHTVMILGVFFYCFNFFKRFGLFRF